ncbi:UDP-N-acetylmuramate:L-alanyl-gamma-D-glutamyl-meso-diaminopimelate ligase [bacterium]|nr:UDP-N-acetylmuramate:L-alanyl-gamma-D-glutamyl-meso-diaminopimelate ligase [bacterium]MBU1985324.1 UDP-N-acetylmuramate:L-alanyl-gamma-D-glutamyl-meso-diaminopimelate ligase [bacterium]
MIGLQRKVFLSGIGGIGMANLAVLLKQAGFAVSGSDGKVYEPAATILRSNAIPVLTPYAAANLPLDGTTVIVGNALSRGHVEVEAALDSGVPLYSFPEFLHRVVLNGRHTIVVAGTHGKSTTTTCLAHLLTAVGEDPGFLVGALPLDFPAGAQIGNGDAPFILEGDEYDTAFFDKRSKFLHYFPRTLVLGSVEFDHADIFATESEMLVSFQRLIRLLPRSGQLIYAADCPATVRLTDNAPCRKIGVGTSENAEWKLLPDSNLLAFRTPEGELHRCRFRLPGIHNRQNALMSIACAHSLGVSVSDLCSAIESFHGLRRRMEKLLETERLVVIDDFAHHPTAIWATLQAVREAYPQHRLIAVLEPRSNTMVRNVFQDTLADALSVADSVIVGTVHRRERIPIEQRLDVDKLVNDLNTRGVSAMVAENSDVPAGLRNLMDHRPSVVVFMSNGDFDGAPSEFVRLMTSSG